MSRISTNIKKWPHFYEKCADVLLKAHLLSSLCYWTVSTYNRFCKICLRSWKIHLCLNYLKPILFTTLLVNRRTLLAKNSIYRWISWSFEIRLTFVLSNDCNILQAKILYKVFGKIIVIFYYSQSAIKSFPAIKSSPHSKILDGAEWCWIQLWVQWYGIWYVNFRTAERNKWAFVSNNSVHYWS